MINEPILVQVVGAVADWPNRCACCNGRAATSFGGSLAGGAPNADWQLPYCVHCLEHIRLSEVLKITKEELAKKEPPVRQHLAISLKAALTIGVGAGVTVGLFLATLFLGLFEFPAWLVVVVAVTVCVFLGAVITRYFYKRQKDRLELRNVHNQLAFDNQVQQLIADARELQVQARLLMQKACGNVGPAVAYEGVQEGRQTFLFYNPAYAMAFVAELNQKVIRREPASVQVDRDRGTQGVTPTRL